MATEKLIKLFPDEFTVALSTEMRNFIDMFFNKGKAPFEKYKERLKYGVLPYLLFIVENSYSDIFTEVEVLVRLFLTLPIGIASAERSFSVLRRLKTYLRSSMTDNRLSSLALLCIERNKANEVNLKSVIKTFAEKKARRGIIL
jgi:hypothetical protein